MLVKRYIAERGVPLRKKEAHKELEKLAGEIEVPLDEFREFLALALKEAVDECFAPDPKSPETTVPSPAPAVEPKPAEPTPVVAAPLVDEQKPIEAKPEEPKPADPPPAKEEKVSEPSPVLITPPPVEAKPEEPKAPESAPVEQKEG